MNYRPLVATAVGGIVLTVLSYIIYVVVLGNFLETNAGSAVGVLRAETGDLMLHFVLFGEFAFAYLLVLLFSRLGVSDAVTGAKEALKVGLLVGFGFNLVQYGSMNIGTLLYHIVDPILFGLQWAAAGAVIAVIVGRGEPS